MPVIGRERNGVIRVVHTTEAGYRTGHLHRLCRRLG
jgi:hypothetical protein